MTDNHANNWANLSRASRQEIADMASALEERGRAPDQLEVNAALLRVLAPVAGDRLLEAGCGSGLLCRQVAPAIAPGGRITGLDISPELLHIARNYASQAGLVDAIQWCAGKAEDLPFADASFTAAFAARLFLHVSKPEVVLGELRRVLRPGGKLVALDWDFESVAVDHSDRNLTRCILHWRCDHYGGNNWSGRQLYRQMVSAGFSGLEVFPVVSVARGELDSLTLSLFRAAQVTREGGGITPNEQEAWVGELRSALASGSFFASIVYFIVSGKR
ncbi:MAG: methyltransferase domain-containing protein [Anaerolineales bacterium]